MTYNYAANLLEIGAIKINFTQKFTWASGIQSPIYTDNRKILSYPEVRSEFISGICNLITERFENVQAISGVATAGIPHGALIANTLNLPMSYVRSSNKSHGLENKIEGVVESGQRVVVVEDLVSTGGSSIEAVKAIQATGAEVLGVVSLFSYNTNKANENFKELGIPYYSLVTVDDLISEANLEEPQRSELVSFLKEL